MGLKDLKKNLFKYAFTIFFPFKAHYLAGNYLLLAEVPSASWVNLQPAEHLKNVSFSF